MSRTPLRTIACIGTGPSLTQDQVAAARRSGFELFVCNNAFLLAPDAALLYAVNYAWWAHYFEQVRELPCEKWTTNHQAATEFGLNLIAERNAPGLSRDRDVIHHGHGSGYSLVSMAHRAGADRILLLGYDCKYARDYEAKNQDPGSTPRHFFGEYPASMQHWPSKQVQKGVHIELVELYRSIARQGLVEVINCTPGSAIDAFPRLPIEEVIP